MDPERRAPADSLERLQAHLRELFQLDLADLDFGIYRLLHLKRREIEAFLTRQLPEQVDQAFKLLTGQERQALETRLAQLAEQVRANIDPDAIGPDGEPKAEFANLKLVQEYRNTRQRLAAVQATEAQHAEVFNHLYNFFARYYDSGDFIPRRHYGSRETYAVPYRGEEVLLHWANQDQHYVKTGEAFRNYAFQVNTLSGPFRVAFVLTEATTPKENTKGEWRFFFPQPKQAKLDAAPKTFTVPFHYRLPTAKELDRYGSNTKGQEAIAAEAVPLILKAAKDPHLLAALSEVVEVKNPDDATKRAEVTLLARRLRHFTKRNTTDYFVHKDLGGFLRRELEFYVKDQVIHQADLEGDFDSKRRMLRVFRVLAEQLITFLDQVEGVQCRLFEKRKLVLRTDYLVPIKDVPRDLWKAVLKNKKQVEAWKTLFAVEPAKDLFNKNGKVNEAFVEAHPTLVVNTALFDADFTDRLLAAFEDVDDATDGLLVHSENYQALRLLGPKYAERVKCIYIDPPYNTGSDEFIYKDRYQHSSWLAMMEERLRQARDLLTDDGALFVSIDDNELAALTHMMRQHVFGPENELATLVWEKGKKGDPKFFAITHEYVIAFARQKGKLLAARVKWRQRKAGADEVLAKYDELSKAFSPGVEDASIPKAVQQHGGRHALIRKEMMSWFRSLPPNDARRTHSHYNWSDDRGLYFADNFHGPDDQRENRPRYEILHPVTGKPCAKPSTGWRWEEPRTKKALEEEPPRIHFGPDETTIPCRKTYLAEVIVEPFASVFYKDGRAATLQVEQIIGPGMISFPKDADIIADLVALPTRDGDVILDSFAGSGTTAHAVINLNRGDNGRRKFVLAEMAGYFDEALLPRIQRVMYAPEWRDRKPRRLASAQEADRTPRLVKVLRLEGYDDALHNLTTEETLQREGTRAEAFSDKLGAATYRVEYLARLPMDSSSSMINLAKLEHPFAYTIEVLTDDGPRTQPVDLVETFNLAYGLHVQRLETWANDAEQPARKYRVVKGRDRDGRKRVLVVWRDMAGLDPKAERQFLEARVQEAGPFEEMWINGDCAVPGFASLDGLFKRLIEEGER